jgi:hypothetical protein
MKLLKDYIANECFRKDGFTPNCLLQQALYVQTRLANIVYIRFPLLYKSYYDVLDLEFDLHVTVEDREDKDLLVYTLNTSNNLEERFAELYPEKVI